MGRRRAGCSYDTVTVTVDVVPSAATIVTTATPGASATAPGLNWALPSSLPWVSSRMSGRSVLTLVLAGSGWLNTMVSPTDAVASAWPGSTMTGAGIPALPDGAAEDAAGLVAELKSRMNLVRIPVYQMPPAIVVHGGPGVMGVAFFEA